MYRIAPNSIYEHATVKHHVCRLGAFMSGFYMRRVHLGAPVLNRVEDKRLGT